MPTGPLSDSAEPPSEPEPPFTAGRRHSWLAGRGRHPVTWAAVGLVLVGSAGVALLQQQQPGVRDRAQTVYCGLVTCAVAGSAAVTSIAATEAPRPSPALPSSEARLQAPAPRRARTPARSWSPRAVASSRPRPASSPRPTAAPTPKPPPARRPGPPRWPWPPTWGPGWPWGGAGGRWHYQPAQNYGQPRGYQQQPFW